MARMLQLALPVLAYYSSAELDATSGDSEWCNRERRQNTRTLVVASARTVRQASTRRTAVRRGIMADC